jgi:anti-sigma-K factor RskA
MKRPSGDLAHALAAEYVLGTLRGRARQRFESWVAEDSALARVVAAWEAGLVPMAERLPGVEPPARVWKAIEARIGRRSDESVWSNAALWRAWAAIASGVAVVLLAFFTWLSQGPRGEPLFVAVLSSAQAVPYGVVSMHSPDVLRIRMVRPVGDSPDRELELWVIPKEGAPRSLGVMPNERGDTIIHITSADPRVRGAVSLAVSLEPPGGSPTKRPTGPMVLSGPIAPVRRS